jgi:hypothetical protein
MLTTSPPPPVALIDGPAGLYLLPRAPLTPEQCDALAEQLAEHARRRREPAYPFPGPRDGDG